jgi:hypothetical protein
MSRTARAALLVPWFFVASMAHAEQTPTVWYRASEQCPDGRAFLDAIGAAKDRTRLAGAGDRIDFVVTIVVDETGTVGRLERATDAGTVAIREVRDNNCDGVAKALALSLGLALGPQTQAPEADRAATEATPDTGSASALQPEQPAGTNRPAPAPAERQQHVAATVTPAGGPPNELNPRSVANAPVTADADRVAAKPIWAVGAHGGIATGLQPGVMGRYGAFAELRGPLFSILPALVLRGGMVTALGAHTTDIGRVRRWLAAADLDVCPVALGGEGLSVAPCVGTEFGTTGASGTRQGFFGDSALWAALTGSMRATWRPIYRWGVHLDLGAVAPLTQHEVVPKGENDMLYGTGAVGLLGGLGLSLALE